MTALSIHLPDAMAKQSQALAKQLGISRTQFIRYAVMHEIERVKKQTLLNAMADDFEKMKTDPEYLALSKEIEEGLNESLPEDNNKWWE